MITIDLKQYKLDSVLEGDKNLALLSSISLQGIVNEEFDQLQHILNKELDGNHKKAKDLLNSALSYVIGENKKPGNLDKELKDITTNSHNHYIISFTYLVSGLIQINEQNYKYNNFEEAILYNNLVDERIDLMANYFLALCSYSNENYAKAILYGEEVIRIIERGKLSTKLPWYIKAQEILTNAKAKQQD